MKRCKDGLVQLLSARYRRATTEGVGRREIDANVEAGASSGNTNDSSVRTMSKREFGSYDRSVTAVLAMKFGATARHITRCRMGKLFVGFILVAGATAVACSSSSVGETVQGCGGRIPGVIVQVAGIDLQVRDPFGVAQAIGTVATVRRSDGTEAFAVVNDTLNIHAAFNVTGTFTVTLSRTYYRDATVANVSVTPDGCVVHTTTVPVALELAPGAPALRAMALVGGDFLDHPGAQATLLAHFDADPGVSRAVNWQVSDATLASVDANGVVTAKCTKSGGTVKVSATSVVDATITSFVNLGVAPTASCA